MTLQKTKNYVLFDMPNTLFDSRHRQINQSDYYIAKINNDTLNYPAYLLLKEFKELGYNIILTHYCLSRLREKVEMLLKHNYMQDTYYKLFTNFRSQDVIDNNSLKKYLYETLTQDINLLYVVDNDPAMKSYWLSKEVALIQVPLGIY